jgi:hypothetical protein
VVWTRDGLHTGTTFTEVKRPPPLPLVIPALWVLTRIKRDEHNEIDIYKAKGRQGLPDTAPRVTSATRLGS